MKQTKLLWLCFMLLLFSCNKEEEAVPKPETSTLIQEAKNYFQAHYKSGAVATESSLNKYGAKFAKVNWAMAKEKEISLGKAVVVPLIFENDVYVSLSKSDKRYSLSNTTFLYMYKDMQQNMHTEVVRYVPNDTYVVEPQKPFLGLVVIEDISGNFKAGYYFDGSKATPFTRSNKSEQTAVNSATAVTSGWCTTTTYYSCPEVGNYPEDCTEVGQDIYCQDDGLTSLTRPSDYETGSMIGDGNISGGGGYNPVPEEPQSEDCNTFEERVSSVLNHEGGYVNDPNDPGGPTNKGIAWETWQQVATSVLGKAPTLQNLKDLTTEEAKLIYKTLYWDAISAEAINDGDLRYLIFDFYINAGGNAIKVLQKTLNQIGAYVSIDGNMGPQTIAAINSSNSILLYNSYKLNRQNYYNNIASRSSKLATFLNGWTNRVNSFKDKTESNSLNVNCK